VNVAHGEGNGICYRWQKATASAHKVLSEGHLCVEAKAKATALASATRDPTASYARRPEASAWVLSSLLDRGRVGRLKYIS
jgi:hypothetical protein